MSTNYFPYCVDCQSGHPIASDRLDDECRALVRASPALAAFADAWADLSTYGYPVMTLGRDRDYIHPEWFKAHAGHHLVVRNEYGDNDDECGKRYQCHGCKHPHELRCRRHSGHDGDHAEGRDDGRP